MRNVELMHSADRVRESARPVRSGFSVGCALLTDNGIVTGTNIEGPWETSIHAEMSAIGNLPVTGASEIQAVAISAAVTEFTPCGACLDWLLWFCTEDAVLITRDRSGCLHTAGIRGLYSRYPKR